MKISIDKQEIVRWNRIAPENAEVFYLQRMFLYLDCLFGKGPWIWIRINASRWCTEALFTIQYLYIYCIQGKRFDQCIPTILLSQFLSFHHATFMLNLAFFLADLFIMVRDVTNQTRKFFIFHKLFKFNSAYH